VRGGVLWEGLVNRTLKREGRRSRAAVGEEKKHELEKGGEYVDVEQGNGGRKK